jgi:hypothetical protein
MNVDIATLLKQFFYDNMGHLLEDKEALNAVFGGNCTEKQASEYLKDLWIINSSLN